MSQEINENFSLIAPQSLDVRTGKIVSGSTVPYISLSEANTATTGKRYLGMTILVDSGAGLKEYWYKDGITNNDLELKTSSGGTGTITSVFGRTTPSIIATSGDYMASQVTNALSSIVSYSNPSWLTGLASSKIIDDSTHRFVTDSDKTIWNAKQSGSGDLTAISALSPVNDDIIQRKSGAWTNRTIAQYKTDLSLTKSDVSLGNVDNVSDLNKPISTATQTALDLKQDSLGYTAVPNTRTINGYALSANITLVKGDLSLGNVDNTSDSTKNSATVTLTNKTISGVDNTITNIGTSGISNSAITYAKIQNIAASRLFGNPTVSSATPSEISLGSSLSFSGSVISVVDNTSTQKIISYSEGSIVGTRKGINFVSGANTTITITDDSVNDRVNVTIDSAGGGGGGTPGGSSGQLQYNNAASFGGTIAGVYTTSGNLFMYTSQAVGDIPLTLKGAASQTGDLFRAVNSSSVILAKITSAGNISATNLSGTNTGDQTITLTGEVTGSGVGSFGTTITANVVSNTHLRTSVALSVIGRSANSTGNVADISAGTDGYVLRRSGTSLGFGQVVAAGITDATITYAKLQNITSQTLLGRYALTAGVGQEITIGTGLDLDDTTGILSATGSGGTCYDTLSIFTANPATTISASTTNYISLNGNTFNSTLANRVIVIPMSGTLKNLFVFASGTQPASGTLVFTIMKASSFGSIADTALIVTISASTAAGTGTVYSNTVDGVSVSAGDLIVIKVVNNATASSFTINDISLLMTN